MVNTIKDHFQGTRDGDPIICTVEYADGVWLFTVSGEGKKSICDSKQARVLGAMLMNPGCKMSLDDIEDAALAGPTVVYRELPTENESEPCDESEDADVPTCLLPTGHWPSRLDPDLLMLLDGEESRHAGDAGDHRLVKDLDRRMAVIDAGIAAAKARGDGKMAAALEEERVALRKARNWYFNSITGSLRPFYPEATEKKAKRCRMWIVRGLQALARGLPKASARLSSAISRGTEFVYEEKPGWEWIVEPIAYGSLPILGEQDGERDGNAATAA